MGRTTHQTGPVLSAGEHSKYGMSSVGDKSPLDVFLEAIHVASVIGTNRDADNSRAQMGDCALGVHVTGILSVEEAAQVAARVYVEVGQQERILRYGGLVVGAEVGLRLFQGEALESAVCPREII